MEEKPDLAKIKMENRMAGHNDHNPPNMPVLSSLLNNPLKTEVESSTTPQLTDPKLDIVTPKHEHQDINESAKPQHSFHFVSEHTASTNKPYTTAQFPDPADGEISAKRSAYNNGAMDKYKCSICDSRFHYLSRLKVHMMIHTGERPHKCSVCTSAFKTSSHLHAHMSTHTADKPHTCDVCTRGFGKSSNLRQHMRTHTRDKPHRCSICNRGFSHLAELHKHKLTHTGEKPVGKLCSTTQFTDPSDGKNIDKRTEAGKEITGKCYKCSICKKDFDNSRHLQQHMSTRTCKETHPCSVCNLGFFCSDKLHRHMISHTGEKPYMCSMCNIRFAQSETWNRHMDIHFNEIPHKSSLCNERVQQSSQLDQHMNIHAGVKAQKCLITTDKSYPTPEVVHPIVDAVMYQNVHHNVNDSGSPDVSVNSVDDSPDVLYPREHLVIIDELNSIPQLIDLTSDISPTQNVCRDVNTSAQPQHISQYADEIPDKQKLKEPLVRSDGKSTGERSNYEKETTAKAYKCSICHKHFTCSSSFYRHLLTHTGEKPHQCSVCNLRFTRSSSLHRHMNGHTNELLHKCSVCRKRFNRQDKLHQHMKSHNKETLHKYSLCYEEFQESSQLDQHMNIHAGVMAQKDLAPTDKPYSTPQVVHPIVDTVMYQNVHHNVNDSGSPHVSVNSVDDSPDVLYPREHLVIIDKLNSVPQLIDHTSDTSPTQNVCRDVNTSAQPQHISQDIKQNLKESSVRSDGKSSGERCKYEKETIAKAYKCSICNKHFSCSSSYNRHLLTHTDEKIHKCPVCSRGFLHTYEIRRHMVSHTGEKPHKCSVCNIGFSRSGTLIQHMKTHSCKDTHKCSVCHEGFQESSKLDQHMTIHEVKRDCSICHKVLSSPSQLHRHMMTHTGERPHKCSVCNKGFIRADKLRRHMTSHTGDKLHQCSMCNMQFLKLSDLNQHMAIHTRVKTEKCLVTPDGPCTTVDVVMSQNVHQDVNGSAAPEVVEEIPDLHFLKKHLVTTEESSSSTLDREPTSETMKSENVYQDASPKPHNVFVDGVPDVSYLNEHLVRTDQSCTTPQFKVPTEGKVSVKTPECEKCSLCNKKFNNVGGLRRHMLIHTGEKPYGCSVCGKRFSQTGNLNQHMMIHTGERRHKCSLCSKGFIRSYELRRHMVYHTGDKPHKCSVCNMQFTQTWSLSRHMKIHFGEIPNKRTVSNEEFQQSTQLDQHVTTHKKVKADTSISPNVFQDFNVSAKSQNSFLFVDRFPNEELDTRDESCSTQQYVGPTSGTSTIPWAFQDITVSEKHHGSFQSKGYTQELTAQMMTHKGETHVRPSSCRSVGYSSNIQETGRQPVTQTDVKPHKCPLCSIRFRKISVLQQHLPLHKTGELKALGLMPPSDPKEHKEGEPYKCSVCKKEVRFLWHFKQHMKTHSGERHKAGKTYKCSVCNKEVKFLSYLKRHMESHSGEKTHKCFVCKKEFKRPSSLKQHIRMHEESEHYGSQLIKNPLQMVQYKWDECHVCPRCIQGFSYQQELTAHMIMHKEKIIVN